jgi:MscS family membrane protein
LAVSLAAQDSIRNLFGSVTIFADQPFNVGDRIQVDGQDGIVEEIGFRSTRLRALTGQLVTIPNARVSDSTVQNFSKRLSIRRIMDVNVTYDTPPEKMVEAIGILRGILAEPEIVQSLDPANPPRVHFDEYGPDFLRIRVWYWFVPVEWWLYNEHAEKINLMVLQRFNAAGIDFAFPSRTLYLAGDSKRKLEIGIGKRDA